MYLLLEFLTDAYRNACSEGEALIYRAHVAVLGHPSAVKDNVIERLLDRSRHWSMSDHKAKGITTSLIKSKFNKVTLETETWRKSTTGRDSSEVTEFRNALLSHIHSRQHSGEIEKELESHSSVPQELEQKKSNENRKQDVKLETPEKECANQFNKIDNETLFFLHRNVQFQEAPDNNIPYSINLWNFDSRDEFSAMNHLFLKPEALILFIMDITLDFLAPFEESRYERRINQTSKTPAEILTNWLNLVYVQAKKQNIKPNIVLLLATAGSRVIVRNQYVKSYIQTIKETVEGKPYAAYISENNIIIVDKYEECFENLRNELFARMLKQPNWAVPRPIRWLCLEADLFRRTANEGQDKYESDLFDFYGREHISSHYRRKLYLLGEPLRRKPVDPLKQTPFVLISKVKELASTYNMDASEVESFLQFHHALGDLIYCPPSKGERCIITNPQWLLDKVEEIISTAKRSKGIVSEPHLCDICGILDVQVFIDLITSFDLILPFDNPKKTYLVPFLLPSTDNYTCGTELTYKAVHNPNVDDILSFGTFHKLIISCAQRSDWKLKTGDHLSRNHASFDVTKGTHLVLYQKKNNTIQVSTWTSKEKLDKGEISNHDIRGFLFDIRKEVARMMEVLGVEQSRNFQMLCPHWRPDDEYTCLVEIEEETDYAPVVFYPKSDKCVIHNKVLEPRLFLRKGEYREGMCNILQF